MQLPASTIVAHADYRRPRRWSMSLDDDAAEARAQGWRTLAALHARIEDALERALRSEHALSVSEYGVLDVLARQDGWHMRMTQLSNAVVLSQSRDHQAGHPAGGPRAAAAVPVPDRPPRHLHGGHPAATSCWSRPADPRRDGVRRRSTRPSRCRSWRRWCRRSTARRHPTAGSDRRLRTEVPIFGAAHQRNAVRNTHAVRSHTHSDPLARGEWRAHPKKDGCGGDRAVARRRACSV